MNNNDGATGSSGCNQCNKCNKFLGNFLTFRKYCRECFENLESVGQKKSKYTMYEKSLPDNDELQTQAKKPRFIQKSGLKSRWSARTDDQLSEYESSSETFAHGGTHKNNKKTLKMRRESTQKQIMHPISLDDLSERIQCSQCHRIFDDIIDYDSHNHTIDDVEDSDGTEDTNESNDENDL